MNEQDLEDLGKMYAELHGAYRHVFSYYEMFSDVRSNSNSKFFQDFQSLCIVDLECIYGLLASYAYINTPLYSEYVHLFQDHPTYIDYVVELPKIKHHILELEVDWYIENLTEYLEILNKKECPPCFKPVLEQHPLFVRHTRTVINRALEQLEDIANKITQDNAKDYGTNKERYTWCLAAMIPLLPEEEQDPFKENGIHQRWQKARIKIQQVE